MADEARRMAAAAGPNLPALEAELARLRQRVVQQRSAVTELRTALDQLSWKGLSLPARLATTVGFVTGLVAAVGGAVLLSQILGG